MLGDLIYSRYRFFASGFAILMIVALWLFLEKTPYGAIIKAGAHDSEMVRALGINLSRLRLLVFAIGVGAGRDRRRRDGADLGHSPACRAWTRWCRPSSSSCWAASARSGAR